MVEEKAAAENRRLIPLPALLAAVALRARVNLNEFSSVRALEVQ